MSIDSITLHTVRLVLRQPFTTATSSQSTRTLLIVSVRSGTLTGWGECSADGTAYCAGENAETARASLTRVAPAYIGSPITEPGDIDALVPSPMAAAALNEALWDLFAKSTGTPLAVALGGAIRPVPSRAVLGQAPDLMSRAEQAVELGYRSLKVKVSNPEDLAGLGSLRSMLPDIGLAIDMNGSAGRFPTGFWKELDDLGLEFVEQPYSPGEANDNNRLRDVSTTPICLDESVRTTEQALRAADRGFLINLKPAKFGGPTSSRHIVNKLPGGQGWWGGMLETGIGRAHTLALATIGDPHLASDLGASDRYYVDDLTDPFALIDGALRPFDSPGIGVPVSEASLARLSIRDPDEFS